MLEPIFSPLNYYLNTAKKTHEGYTREYLRLLNDTAKVDREANKQTVASLRSHEASIQQFQQQASGKKTGKTLIIVGLCVAFFVLAILCLNSSMDDVWKCIILLGGVGGLIFGIVFTCIKMNEKIRSLNTQIAELQQKANTLKSEAWKQATPLNALFQDDDSLNLFTKTLPFITFDKCFTHTRLEELVKNYGFYAGLNGEECTLDTLSGELYGSPFVYIQKLCHRLGMKTYSGSLTITWTTTERDSQGRLVSRHHSQVLTATISRPAPYYNIDTALYFGNEAVPNVNFSRSYAHMEDKSEAAIAKAVRKGEKKLQRKHDKALKKGENFTPLANTEFEVLFGATDRTDELAFRYLFTASAQQNMLELIRSSEGYGDDFDFYKSGKLNTIVSDHAQYDSVFPKVRDYASYSFKDIEKNFKTANQNFFKKLYFDIAPLIAIPCYQQPLVESKKVETGGFSNHVYQIMARLLGKDTNPSNVETNVIYNTGILERQDGADIVSVRSCGYYTEQRTDYVPVFGGDGHMHSVPVDWDEYIPIDKTSKIKVWATDGKEGESSYLGVTASFIS